jgi:Flp pilus assembly pilin Flp
VSVNHRDRQRDHRGAAAVEYALILGLVALCILAGMGLFGTRASSLFTDSCESMAGAQHSHC